MNISLYYSLVCFVFERFLIPGTVVPSQKLQYLSNHPVQKVHNFLLRERLVEFWEEVPGYGTSFSSSTMFHLRRSRFGIFIKWWLLDKDDSWAVICSLSSSKFQEKTRPPMVCCTSSPMVSAHQGRAHLAGDELPLETPGVRGWEELKSLPESFRPKFQAHLN